MQKIVGLSVKHAMLCFSSLMLSDSDFQLSRHTKSVPLLANHSGMPL